MRLHAQCLIEGYDLGGRASLRTPTDAALPLERPKEAGDLTRSEALAPHSLTTHWAGRPPRRATGPFGQHVLDNVDHQHTS
jgi:hypothetical protein